MEPHRPLRWPLVLGLGALALIRPLARVVEDQLDVDGTALVPIALTLLVSSIWGLTAGAVALLVQRLRGGRPQQRRPADRPATTDRP